MFCHGNSTIVARSRVTGSRRPLRARSAGHRAQRTGPDATRADRTGVVAPAPDPCCLKRAVENAGAADVTLTQADLDTIHNALPNGSYGNRYPEALQYDGLSKSR